MKITIVAGARPNFMKIAPIINELKKMQSLGRDIQYRLVHTGQHYDKNMSSNFFIELGIPDPNINLHSGGGTATEQTSKIMIEFEKELIAHPADLVLVVGDVNSTMACTIVAKKMQIKVAHVEAGIRSWDYCMPEEINRLVTDSICDYFFTTSKTANLNLKNCGISDEKIYFVGNTMIDTLLANFDRLQKPFIFDSLSLKKRNYIILTLHRPSNVDDEHTLFKLISTISESANGLPIVFPVHPRTAKKLEKIVTDIDNLFLVEPLSYLEFNYLVKNCLVVLTDSGGVTEETTVMHIPCMTLRDSTERPETVDIGTNILLGTNINAIQPAFKKLFNNQWRKGEIPELWDGNAAVRIVEKILEIGSNLK